MYARYEEPQPSKGKAFVSIFDVIFDKNLETTRARTWAEFFSDLYGSGTELKQRAGVDEALDNLEKVGYDLVLIAPCSHFHQWMVGTWLQGPPDLRYGWRIPTKRQIVFKTPHPAEDVGSDWLAGIVATQGGALWFGSKAVSNILGTIAPHVKCYENFLEATLDGPLTKFKDTGMFGSVA